VNEPLNPVLADAVNFLTQRKVPFAVIGGIAVSVRGELRATADVDLVLAIGVEEALGLVQALEDSAFEPLFAGVTEVVRRSFILPVRHRSTGLRVDLALGLSGFEQQAIARAETVQFGECSVPVVTSEDLLLMKLLAGRPRDLEDIEGIVALRGNELDWDYCCDMAQRLGEAVAVDLRTQLDEIQRRLT
jgi:predicted nucleotidyltransferase